MQAKPILFCDFDGVLCHDRFWRSLSYVDYARVQEFLFQNNKPMVHEWMVGKYSAEEIVAHIADALNMSYELLWNSLVHDAEHMRVNTKALEKLHNLRSRYTTILFTANMDSFHRFTIPKHNLDKYFDAIVNTYIEGVSKIEQDGLLLQKYAAQHEAPINSCILFDDHRDVIDTMHRLGGRGYLITHEKDIDWHLDRVV
jgi:FMN phosphatase YigB (HAD superfamily)